MKIRQIKHAKKRYLSFLRLADEQDDMIFRYLERGTMYALFDRGVKCVCVVTDEGNGVLELKNIATKPGYLRNGYGRALVSFLATTYAQQFSVLQVGTGDSPLTIPFFVVFGFHRSHRIANFFLDHYDHPIFENGVQLVDMIYLKRDL